MAAGEGYQVPVSPGTPERIPARRPGASTIIPRSPNGRRASIHRGSVVEGRWWARGRFVVVEIGRECVVALAVRPRELHGAR